MLSAGVVLRCSLPFRGAPGCLCLCVALPCCVLLLGLALLRCVFVLASATLCRWVLCCAVVRLLVLCCVVCFVAVVGLRLASSAAVAGCCALSVLGRGPVSSRCVACGAGAAVPCAMFLGASLFVAPRVRCCVGVPAWLLPVRCSLASVALAGVVCCCLLCLGLCRWAWLSSVVSWWVRMAPGNVFRWCCPCLAAWLAAMWFGVVCLGGPLPCVVFCGAVLSCAGVLCCSAVCLRCYLCMLFFPCSIVSSGAVGRPGVVCLPALCFVVFLRAVCSVLCMFCRGDLVCAAVCCCPLCCMCPWVLCCAFPVLSALCSAALRCPGALRCAVRQRKSTLTAP